MIRFGHIEPFWDEGFKNFPYVKQPITNHEVSDWQKQGYDHVKSFTGWMYDNRSPMPDYIDSFNVFGLKNQVYCFYKMKTLEIMPVHSDQYLRYIDVFKADPKKVCRVLVMLEDWKPGHYLEIDSVGYVNWKKGDWFLWQSDVPHAASNIGVEDRYTIQITGELIE
jgi:hypothetical protein